MAKSEKKNFINVVFLQAFWILLVQLEKADPSF
jgi:hypothetical protein